VRTRILIVALVAAPALPGTAWAHATLVRTSPAGGAVVARAPAAVRVVFDDVVKVGPGIAAIRNGRGTVLAGRARVEAGRTLVIPLRRGLGDGDYSVRWVIVSDDGHVESGVLAFAVGAGRPPPTAALTPGSNRPETGSVVSRWLFFIGVLGAVGISLFALLNRPRDGERIALVLSSSAVLAAFGAADEAHRVGLDTRAGTAFGSGFLLAVVVASLAGAATLDRRALRPALLLALGLAVVPSFSGHALDRGLNRVNVAADILHVAGASAWIGALLGLVVARDAPRRRTVLLAAGGVALLGVTGIVRASFELVRFSQLWHTSYGQALLVKTAILAAALTLGWLLRADLRHRAAAELVVAGGLIVAVAVLVLLQPGRNVEAALVNQVQAAEPGPPPPRPPAGAVVLARALGPLGVALETEKQRTTAIVLSPAGGGLNGLEVRLGDRVARACGAGCYRVLIGFERSVHVEIDGFGQTLAATFELPQVARPAGSLIRRAERRYDKLKSVFFVEHLSSGPSHELTSLWRLEAPNRVSYAIPGGAQGIVIGSRRWDRNTSGAKWVGSAQTPVPQPVPPWSEVRNANVIADDGPTKTVTFVDPTTPAYFEVTLDARTLLPRLVRMTAAAHFMTDRYAGFNEPPEIVPPR
jgi:copper transport protein